jgi:beta-glucuronidase
VHATLNGTIDISVRVGGQPDDGTVEILDADGVRVAGPIPVDLIQGSAQCTVDVRDPELWAPASPYLYAACVRLRDASGKECDRYVEHFGFREITIEKGTLLLNGKPLYLAGFGKHEDFPVVGRGQFRPGYIRDFELLRWIGANSFRTSHYPYDDEILYLADRLGFLVIDEAPAVSLGFPSDRFEALAPLLETHRRVLTELVERDRNHPCVIAWSPMNEPNLWSEPQYQNDASRRYFREVNDHVHALDPSRPTIAITMAVFTVDDVALESCDIIGINRYYGWYTEPGELGRARTLLENEMDALHARYNKPIMITECGVDTVEGYHASTAQMFTEEYQIEYLRTYAAVADQRPFCAGFHAWNFADFLTPQHFRRVVLNRKGVFTRDRDPKGAAFFLREHWRTLDRLDPAHRPRQYCDKFLVSDLRSPCS